jgi:hypothetical protein
LVDGKLLRVKGNYLLNLIRFLLKADQRDQTSPGEWWKM